MSDWDSNGWGPMRGESHGWAGRLTEGDKPWRIPPAPAPAPDPEEETTPDDEPF
jgi:hypothetical protein